MQQQEWAKSTTRIKHRAVLLIWLAAIGIAGCQQPTKPLLKETKQEKPTNPSSPKQDKPNNQQGEITYKGLELPESLARSPQRLRELIFQGQQIRETEPHTSKKK